MFSKFDDESGEMLLVLVCLVNGWRLQAPSILFGRVDFSGIIDPFGFSENQMRFPILIGFDTSVKAGTVSNVAGRAVASDAHAKPDGILIAVSADFNHFLNLA